MSDDETPWLNSDERQLWLSLHAFTTVFPSALEAQLQNDADMSLFEYYALAMLSEAPDRELQMSALAGLTNGSLSRLSHVVKRLERHGWITRRTADHDRRATLATLTDAGMAAIKDAAPAHVKEVRRLLFAPLSDEQQRQLASIMDTLLNAGELRYQFPVPPSGPAS